MRHLVLTFRNSLRQKMFLWFWRASSLVGAIMMAWHWGELWSILWRVAMEKVAVFPVPDWA